MEATLELLGHAMPLHEGRWRAHIRRRHVRIRRKGRVVRERPGEHLELPVRDVLQCRWNRGRDISRARRSLGCNDGQDGRVRPVDFAAGGGGEGGDGLGRGEHLRLTEVPGRGTGKDFVVNPGRWDSRVVLVVGGGGVGVVRVVGRGVGVALQLPPFEARIWESGFGIGECKIVRLRTTRSKNRMFGKDLDARTWRRGGLARHRRRRRRRRGLGRGGGGGDWRGLRV
jgi:hypothetical protein